MKYEDFTSKIIGASMRVHTKIGCGFQEVIYQRALAIELTTENLAFSREIEVPIYYGENLIGSRRADFIVEDVIMVEIKALDKLESLQMSQALNYLHAYKLEIGLLINFGSKSLEFRRVHNNPLLSKIKTF